MSCLQCMLIGRHCSFFVPHKSFGFCESCSCLQYEALHFVSVRTCERNTLMQLFRNKKSYAIIWKVLYFKKLHLARIFGVKNNFAIHERTLEYHGIFQKCRATAALLETTKNFHWLFKKRKIILDRNNACHMTCSCITVLSILLCNFLPHNLNLQCSPYKF